MDRIGYRTEDGVIWPSRSISGQEYQQPASTLNIDANRFVVIENETVAQIEAALAELLSNEEGSTDERPVKSTRKTRKRV